MTQMCTSPVKIAKEYHMCTCQKSLTVKLGHENNYVLINQLINHQLIVSFHLTSVHLRVRRNHDVPVLQLCHPVYFVVTP